MCVGLGHGMPTVCLPLAGGRVPRLSKELKIRVINVLTVVNEKLRFGFYNGNAESIRQIKVRLYLLYPACNDWIFVPD